MTATMPIRVLPPMRAARHRPFAIVERNALAYRRLWFVFLAGFAEPVLFLLSIGVGVGTLVGQVDGPGGPVDYKQFVAPGMMAAAAMNGSVFDTTFNFFVKFKYLHTYDSVIATPLDTTDIALGEVTWALLRGAIYSTGFLVTMAAFGLVPSAWALLTVPVSVLIGFAFACTGLAATTWMRSFIDFDYVNLALTPLFLFSATFFPLSRYPDVLAHVVRVTPLYQGVVLQRALVLGEVHWGLLLNAVYLVVLGAVSLRIASARLGRLLRP
jgi:lipooligosaccharide transport system permease protein